MKIIKITHAHTNSGNKTERESILINTYNIESFLLQQEPVIIEETRKQFVKLIEDMKPKPKSNPGVAE
ncbi:MAG: hypothetical protein ABI180_10945 [Microcoleus sp.]